MNSADNSKNNLLLERLINIDLTNYKFSRYNISLQDDGVVFIFNTKTSGCVCILAPYKVDAQIFENLVNLGIVVKKSNDEVSEVINRFKRIRNEENIMRLIILPSEACNFRCTYCYETFSGLQMQKNVADSIITFTEKHIKKLNTLEVSWFGGEPLLAINQILYVTERCKNIADNWGVNFISDITTNGYLLTPKIFNKLINNGIKGYQITIDGDSNVHNRLRKLKNGKGTFQKIWTNLQGIKNIKDDFYFVIRTNFDKQTSHELRKWIVLFSNEFKNNKKFKLVFRPIFRTGTERDQQLQLCSSKEGAQIESDCALLLWEKQGFPFEYLSEVILPHPKTVCCYGGLPNCFVIGADGKIWKCTVGMREEDVIGILKKNGDIEFNVQKMNEWNKYTEEWLTDNECLECVRLPLCMGGCILSRKNGRKGCYGSFDSIMRAMKIYYYKKLKGGDKNDYY